MNEGARKLAVFASIFFAVALVCFGVAASIRAEHQAFRRTAHAEPAVVVGLVTREVFDGRQGQTQQVVRLRVGGRSELDDVEVGSLRGLRVGERLTAYVDAGPPREVRLLDGFFTSPPMMVFFVGFGVLWVAVAVVILAVALVVGRKKR